MIAIPLFAISALLTQMDFNILWRYFSWANQATAAIALWIATMYLFVKGKNYFVSLIPALFITLYGICLYLESEDWIQFGFESFLYCWNRVNGYFGSDVLCEGEE